MDLDRAFALPIATLRQHLAVLNTTTKTDGTIYWHRKIVEPGANQFALQLPKSANRYPSNRLRSPLKWTTATDKTAGIFSGEMNHKFEDGRNISAEETIITRKGSDISLKADPRLSSLVDCIHDCTIISSELD